MPLDIFNPIPKPSTPSNRQVDPRTNTAQFGDGYSQRSEDGLNAAPRTMSAQWQGMAAVNADVIEAFLEAHTSSPFLWTIPLEPAQRKWIALKWARGYLGGGKVSLTATLKEVFDL